jgi:hypothetical protein
MTFKRGKLYHPRSNTEYLIFVVQVSSDPSRNRDGVEVTVMCSNGLIEREIVLTPTLWVEL